MLHHLLRRLAPALLALFAAMSLSAAEPSIINRARAYLGGEAALNSIQTLHYHGTLELPDAPAENQVGPIAVEIIFQKPFRQRSVITSSRGTEITVLDDYDGWQRVEAADDPTRWTLVLLKTDQIKSLRANVWENLAFFRGLDAAGGSTEDLGRATVDGIVCRKLAFIHSPDVTFYRYFDETSGRLVLTETKRGESIREEGYMEVNGIKFPRVLVTETTQPDGSRRTVRITFERISINTPVADSLFAMPPLTSP